MLLPIFAVSAFAVFLVNFGAMSVQVTLLTFALKAAFVMVLLLVLYLIWQRFK